MQVKDRSQEAAMSSSETSSAVGLQSGDSKVAMWKRAIAIGGAIIMAPVIAMALLFVFVTVIPVFVFVLPMIAASWSHATVPAHVSPAAPSRPSSLTGRLAATAA
jgi:hypothetical protein